MNVVIVAAGKSERFKAEKIKTPKYLLKVQNKTILENIIDNYNEKLNFQIIVNQTDYKNHYQKLYKISKKNLKMFKF